MAEATWGDLLKSAKIASEPIPEGQHNAKIVDAVATKTASGDKLMFKIKLEIVDGPAVKRRVTANQTVSPENGTALAIFFRAMEAIGLTEAFFAGNPNPDQIAAAMINRQVCIVIKHGSWNGAVTSNVDRWIAMGGGLGGLPAGPVAPGTVIGNAPTPLPTGASATPTAGSAPTLPTTAPESPASTAGPVAPTDAPPALPI